MRELERFDLVVIGSGPAGEKGAAQAAWAGRRVALVERAAEVGGASVHTGTLPSKTLRETALYLTGFRRRELYGMSVRLDRKKSLRQLVGRLHEVTDRQTRQIRRNLDRHAVTLVSGFASFEDDRTLSVIDRDGQVARRLTADVFLLATGSSPVFPKGISIVDPDVVDSDRILQLDRVPSRLTVVGGGVVGTEYASLFAALGTKITLVEGRDRILAGVDEELSTTVQLSLESMGAEILLGAAVESISRIPGKKTNALRLKLASGRRILADKLLFSAGRTGNTRGMNLPGIGVELTERGHVQVNEHFQTKVPWIYAAGDVIGFPALSATSMEQGRVAMCHAFGIPYKKALSPHLPYGIYSIPEVSSVGPSEQDLQAKGTDYEVGRARFENNARGQITGESEGMLKLLFDPLTKNLIAAHVVGEGATELIHVPMFVIASGGTIDAFIDAVFNFPTLSESFKYAAYDGLQRLTRRQGRAAPATPRIRSIPATREWFVGVAAAGATPGGVPVLRVCAMDRWRRCRFSNWTLDDTGAGLLSEQTEAEGFILALPVEGDGAGNLLAGLRARGLTLAGDASEDEVELVLVEPCDFWEAWRRGGKLVDVGSPSARRQRYELLRTQGLDIPAGANNVTSDQLEAAARALAAYLWATGQAETLGPRVRPAAG